ncbi:MAG: DEAD/DEAH box helicase [Porphyromonadaceae bacterium]|nr:MAG: DEAD/DEAH box helicase [Porphyromonadaceae bacterium]
MSLFEEFGLRKEILSAIAEMGFEQPTPIQEETIPYLLIPNADMIGLAQTGTGKTAGFGLPILQQIDFGQKTIQALVLCPTRELCMQITKDMQNFSKYVPEFKIVAVYGGASIQSQIQALRAGVHMVVATPGRAMDLLNRKLLKVQHVRWLVLDEADEMLSMGFKDDLDAILSDTPKEKQTLLFSATMPNEIREIAGKYMHDPVMISVGKKNAGAENVQHEYYVVHAKDRYQALKRVVDLHPLIYGIVFCRTRAETQEVADKLMGEGYNADVLHGDLSQAQRDFVMSRFRQKHLQLLVATDVAARGLDVNDLTHVINYNLPDELDVYIHRSGRTGRAGKTGTSISIIHTREPGKVPQLEKLLSKKFIRKQVPGGMEICEKQLFNLIDKVETVEVNESQIDPFLKGIYSKLSWLERDELIKRFVSVEFNRFLSFYENAPDLNANVHDHKSPDSRDGKSRRDRMRFSRLFINLGTKNDMNPSNLIGLINERTGNKSIQIGKIEMMKKFSFVEVDSRFEREVMGSFRDCTVDGIRVSIELKTSEGPREERLVNFTRPGRKSNRGDQREKRR